MPDRRVRVRPARSEDLRSIVTVFTTAVHGSTRPHYDEEQRLAWAPPRPDLGRWRARLAGLRVLVAERSGQVVGFVGYRDDGYVDLLYVAPSQARRGVARALHAAMDERLDAAGVASRSADASEVARPFFEALGYRVVAREVVRRGGVALPRYRMDRAGPQPTG